MGKDIKKAFFVKTCPHNDQPKRFTDTPVRNSHNPTAVSALFQTQLYPATWENSMSTNNYKAGLDVINQNSDYTAAPTSNNTLLYNNDAMKYQNLINSSQAITGSLTNNNFLPLAAVPLPSKSCNSQSFSDMMTPTLPHGSKRNESQYNHLSLQSSNPESNSYLASYFEPKQNYYNNRMAPHQQSILVNNNCDIPANKAVSASSSVSSVHQQQYHHQQHQSFPKSLMTDTSEKNLSLDHYNTTVMHQKCTNSYRPPATLQSNNIKTFTKKLSNNKSTGNNPCFNNTPQIPRISCKMTDAKNYVAAATTPNTRLDRHSNVLTYEQNILSTNKNSNNQRRLDLIQQHKNVTVPTHNIPRKEKNKKPEITRLSHNNKRTKQQQQPLLTSNTNNTTSTGALLSDIVKKVTEKNVQADRDFWNKYADIQSMAAETRKEAVVEILENFAIAHKKHVYLFHRLKTTILQNLDDYGASDLATICHSFVLLGFLHEDFIQAISYRVVATIHECNAIELTRLLDAYASLRCCTPEPLHLISEQTLKHLDEFSISDLMTHISSFARLNLQNRKLFLLVVKRLLTLEASNENVIAEDETKEVSTTTDRKPKIKGKEAQKSTAIITETVKDDKKADTLASTGIKFNARDLALAAYAFAKLGFNFPAVFQFISRQARAVIRDFTAHQIQMIAVAFQRLGIRDVALFHEMSIQAQRRMAQFNAESIALLLKSYSIFKLKDEALFTRVVAQLPRLILTFRPLDVATTLSAFSRLNVISPALMTILVPHIITEKSKFEATDLQNVLHSCAELGYVNSDFLHAFASACDLNQLSPSQLTTVALDVGRLVFRNITFLKLLRDAIMTNIDYINPEMATQIFTSFLSLNVHSSLDFITFLKVLSIRIQTAWQAFGGLRLSSSQQSDIQKKSADTTSHQSTSNFLPFTPVSLAILCWTELTIIFAASYSFESIEKNDEQISCNDKNKKSAFPPTFCTPIPPADLIQYFFNIKNILLSSSNFSLPAYSANVKTTHNESVPYLVLEQLNAVRAVAQALNCYENTFEIAHLLDFARPYRLPTACTLGFRSGFLERESEYGLQEIATILRSSCGIQDISICLSSVGAYDTNHICNTTSTHVNLKQGELKNNQNSTTESKQPIAEATMFDSNHLKTHSSFSALKDSTSLSDEFHALGKKDLDGTSSAIMTTKTLDKGHMNILSKSKCVSNLMSGTGDYKPISDKNRSIQIVMLSNTCHDEHHLNTLSPRTSKTTITTPVVSSRTEDTMLFENIPFHTFLSFPATKLNLVYERVPDQLQHQLDVWPYVFEFSKEHHPKVRTNLLQKQKHHRCSSFDRCTYPIRSCCSDTELYNNFLDNNYDTSCESTNSSFQNEDPVFTTNHFRFTSSRLRHMHKPEHEDSITSKPETSHSIALNADDYKATVHEDFENDSITFCPKNSDILGRKTPHVLILWGGAGHYFCEAAMNDDDNNNDDDYIHNVWKSKKLISMPSTSAAEIENKINIGHTTGSSYSMYVEHNHYGKPQRYYNDDNDDDDDDDDDEDEEETLQEVIRALKLYQYHTRYFTPAALTQLALFSSQLQCNLILYIVPCYIWNNLKTSESRRTFLAAILSDKRYALTLNESKSDLANSRGSVVNRKKSETESIF